MSIETLLVLLARDRERVSTLSLMFPVGAGRGVEGVLLEGVGVVEGVGGSSDKSLVVDLIVGSLYRW